MPAGLDQIVGDTGWRLSQGERGRVFMARALLERAELTVLDESLGALDPENVRLGIECALARSRALLLIAHP
jgi:ATP-binding cassette subfamily B protein